MPNHECPELLTQPLMRATMRGDVGAVRHLIARGADVNAAARGGWTPLYAAARLSHFPVVELLRTAGARDDLLTAVLLGDAPLVRRLLDEGAEANITDERGITPLMRATGRGSLEIVRSLIEHGANPHCAHPDCGTASDWITRQNAAALVEIFEAAGAEVDLVGRVRMDDVSALAMARRGRQAGSGPEPSDGRLLRAAVNAGAHGCLDLLLSQGVPVENSDSDVHSLLVYAHDPQTIQRLVAAGADVNHRDSYGWSPLHHAAHSSLERATDTLLELGAEINVRDAMGRTPLATAYLSPAPGRLEVAHRLREAGGILGSSPEELGERLAEAVESGDGLLVRALLEGGAAPDWRDDRGETPLIIAARQDYRPILEALVEGGADVNAMSAQGVTPLVSAAERGDCGLVDWLLAHGARVRGTPGWLARRRAESRGYTATAALLKQAGAPDHL